GFNVEINEPPEIFASLKKSVHCHLFSKMQTSLMKILHIACKVYIKMLHKLDKIHFFQNVTKIGKMATYVQTGRQQR
ncbi:MAG: hypothetical protein VXX73_15455, partial [Pseudomonadota bacterium]|nr:hypothetical protein [Pseudomonadota bacterium]